MCVRNNSYSEEMRAYFYKQYFQIRHQICPQNMAYLELAYLEFAYSTVTFYSNMYLYIYNFSKQPCIQTGSKYK